jgi:hypothetical protein
MRTSGSAGGGADRERRRAILGSMPELLEWAFDEPRDRVQRAVVQACADLGYTVLLDDPAAGLVQLRVQRLGRILPPAELTVAVVGGEPATRMVVDAPGAGGLTGFLSDTRALTRRLVYCTRAALRGGTV